MTVNYNRVILPANLPIPGGLRQGKQIILRGRFTHEHQVFAINIADNRNGDVLLHFNPRFNEGVVVRNTCSGGNWGGEERHQPHFPFVQGRSFILRIEVGSDAYSIYLDGKPFCSYGHRIDLHGGNTLQLGPGVEYYDITFKDTFKTPYNTELPGKLQAGKAFRIRGTTKGTDGFAVNFSNDSDHQSIAFHFNPRPSSSAVVRNANLGGWGEEEVDFDYPFDYPFNDDEYFDLMFVCTEEKFHVYVNENAFVEFNHRSDFNDISYLQIVGDIEIADLEMLEPVDDDFVKEIPSGLEKKDVLLFRGFMKPDAERFAINLHYGLDISSDIALHLNPRIDEGEIVFNSRTDDSWEDEEREGIPSEIAERKPFEMKIVAKKNKFKVYVNGHKYKKFRSRGDVEKIQGINVTSGVYMYLVKLERAMEKPVLERIPSGLRPGSWIIIQGMPKKKCDSFAVNLKCGEDDGSDIALHYNPRFDGRCTVRNTFIDGNWQEEERDEESFPFDRKDTMEMVIKVLEDKFRTYINGERHFDFNHRIPFDRICHLELNGMANFYDVEFL